MSASGLPMRLRVPSDARFRPILLTMARRVAESVGFSAADAAAVGQELAARTDAVTRKAPLAETTPIDVTFDVANTNGAVFRVRARCGGSDLEVTRPLPLA
ncbi:MAG: hypothetical protein HYU53_02495 [Acidobacteria bacterium]|nr:hypothetical protein [Acidobacteriota bacterium]